MGNRNCLSLSVPGMEGETTMKSKQLILGAALLISIGVLTMAAQQNETPTQKAAADQSAVKQAGKQSNPNLPTEGERIFQRRCSNCHNAPDGFSSRISGTVVRHMRVRASLSKHEEEALLRFFNP